MAGDLARMEKGTYNVVKADCDVLGIIRGARVNLDKLFALKSLAFAVSLDGRPAGAGERAPARGDANLLGNLFENLLKNAAEASPQGGEVAVDIRLSDGTVAVRNQGRVDPEIVDTFFEKYVTRGKTFGTGLGTYSARLIARAHGGDAALDLDEPDQVTVRVLLPGLKAAR
jgi:signal transduction histidine kinase